MWPRVLHLDPREVNSDDSRNSAGGYLGGLFNLGRARHPNDLNRLTCCALLEHEVSDFVKKIFCSILAAQSVTIVPANWARKCVRRTGQNSYGSNHSRSCARGRCL